MLSHISKQPQHEQTEKAEGDADGLRQRRGTKGVEPSVGDIPLPAGRFEMGDSLFMNFGILSALMLTIALPERSALASQNLPNRNFRELTVIPDFRRFVIETLEGPEGDFGNYQRDQLEFNISVGRGRWIDTKAIFMTEWAVATDVEKRTATRWLFEHFPVAKVDMFYTYHGMDEDVAAARVLAQTPERLLSWSSAFLMLAVVGSLICAVFLQVSPARHSLRAFAAFWDSGVFWLLVMLIASVIAGITLFFAGANRIYDDSTFFPHTAWVDPIPWLAFFVSGLGVYWTISFYACCRSMRQHPYMDEGNGLEIPEGLDFLLYDKPGVRVIVEGNSVGAECLVGRESAFTLNGEDAEEVPEALEARGVTPETWRQWTRRLEEIKSKGRAWDGIRCAHCLFCLFLCPLFCFCNYLGIPNAANDPYQQAFKAWMADFNREVLEPKGIYLKAFTFKGTTNNKRLQTGRSLSVLAFALDPDEAERFKQMRVMQNGLHNTDPAYACCAHAGTKRVV